MSEGIDEIDADNIGTALYRHFDKDDRLLYVGVSLNALIRLQQHRACSDWFSLIRKMTIEYFPTREAALSAEILAIQSERPLHNVAMTERSSEIRKRRSEESRMESIKRLVAFNPIYKLPEVSQLLRVGPTAIRELIDTGELGHVVIRNGRRVTGWQIIDYIEDLQYRYGEQS